MVWLGRRWNTKVIEVIGQGDRARLEQLRQQGIRMDARSQTGECYLHRVAAIRLGWAGGIAEALIELGSPVNAATHTNTRPLHTAVLTGNLDVAQVLLDHGAEIDARTAFGFTALHHAVGNDEYEVVKLLLARGANPQLVTDAGSTPLAIAERNEAWEIADLLWDSHCPPRVNRAHPSQFRFMADTPTIH